MSTLRTAGELRGFLAEVLTGIRDGSVDTNRANAIAKVAAQINQSLTTEINTALQMQKIGGGLAVPGSMVICESDEALAIEAPETNIQVEVASIVKPAPACNSDVWAGKINVWCEQCETTVGRAVASKCSSAFCKVRPA